MLYEGEQSHGAAALFTGRTPSALQIERPHGNDMRKKCKYTTTAD
jgi:hypothetical protein